MGALLARAVWSEPVRSLWSIQGGVQGKFESPILGFDVVSSCQIDFVANAHAQKFGFTPEGISERAITTISIYKGENVRSRVNHEPRAKPESWLSRILEWVRI